MAPILFFHGLKAMTVQKVSRVNGAPPGEWLQEVPVPWWSMVDGWEGPLWTSLEVQDSTRVCHSEWCVHWCESAMNEGECKSHKCPVLWAVKSLEIPLRNENRTRCDFTMMISSEQSIVFSANNCCSLAIVKLVNITCRTKNNCHCRNPEMQLSSPIVGQNGYSFWNAPHHFKLP